MYVQEAVHLYMDALYDAGVPDGTMRTRRTVLYRLARTFHGRKYRGLSKKDLAAFLYGPEGILIGVTANTRSVYRSSIKGLFEYGDQMGWGPALAIPKPVIRLASEGRRETPPTRLPEPVLGQLLETCSETNQGRVLRCMLAVAMNTAWRVSDIRKLKVGQIDLIGGNLNFISQKTRKRDAFPISLDLEDEVRLYMAWYTEASGVTWRDTEAFMFPGWDRYSLGYKQGFRFEPNPWGQVSYSWALRRLQEHLLECGIKVEPREAWHVVRRSVARIYFDSLRNDISYAHALKQTAALLQHDSTATTEIYLGLSTELEARDASIRGKRFIGVQRTDSVIPFRAAR